MSEHVASPRAWLDENYVTHVRADVTPEEATELSDMLGEAFNSGVASGYAQALARYSILCRTFVSPWTGKRVLEVGFWRWYATVGFGTWPRAGRRNR